MSLTLHVRAVNVGLPDGLYKVLGIGEALMLQHLPKDILLDLRNGPAVALNSVGT